MDVRRPDWWPYPERCGNGHEWEPGRVLVVWQRCLCPVAQTLHEDRAIWGHFTVACPSVKTLTQHYGIAQGTAERALAVLRDEGLIRSRIGRGHFVVRD